MVKKFTIPLAVLLLLLIAYLGAPFVMFPYQFQQATQTDTVWGKVWNNAYQPWVIQLPADNWYNQKFDQMMLELCRKYPDHCAEQPENAASFD